MIYRKSHIKKIILEELETATDESYSIDDLSSVMIEIYEDFVRLVVSEEKDSKYKDLMLEMFNASRDSVSKNSTSEDGIINSIIDAADFYTKNARRFPISQQPKIKEFSKMLETFLTEAPPPEDEIEDMTKSLALT